MIKLKDLYPNQPSFIGIKEESVNEAVISADKIDSRNWRNLKYDLRVGEDYGVFQNAKGTAKILKQIQGLMHKI